MVRGHPTDGLSGQQALLDRQQRQLFGGTSRGARMPRIKSCIGCSLLFKLFDHNSGADEKRLPGGQGRQRLNNAQINLALSSTCTPLPGGEGRRRLGNARKINFSCYCARLALPLQSKRLLILRIGPSAGAIKPFHDLI